MTSAPKSASHCVATAPGRRRVRSRTVIPSSAVMSQFSCPSFHYAPVRLNHHPLIALIHHRRLECPDAALSFLHLLVHHTLGHVHRIANEHWRDESQLVDPVKRDDRFVIGCHLHSQAS